MRSADLAQKIFSAADTVRGPLDATEYQRVLSVVLLLKWASDHPEKLTIPERAEWDRLKASADTSAADTLRVAVAALSDSNPEILGKEFRQLASLTRLTDAQAKYLIGTFDSILEVTGDSEQDDELAGRAYEQLLYRFTDKRGEFSTPPSVSRLMAQLADPQPGHSAYDPCVGTGGLLIAADTYVADHTGQTDALSLFGQDINQQTCTVARLNLLLHNITNATVRAGDALENPSYLDDSGSLRSFDRVVTDPPFSLKGPRKPIPQHTRYGVSRLADLMFVQHVLASLTPDGVGVVTVPHGVLFRGGAEGQIRQGLLEDGRIAAVITLGRNIFHATSIPASLLVLRGEHSAKTSPRNVLFINAENELDVARAKNHLAPRHIERIATTFHSQEETNHFSRLVSIGEIASKQFSLNVSAYIDPPPTPVMSPDVGALLTGGIPVSEVGALQDRFAAFGIDPTSLFVPREPGYLDFPPEGYETIAATIPKRTAPVETEFTTAVEHWTQQFRADKAILTGEPLATARKHFSETFLHALSASAIVNNEQLSGLFADWWVTNEEDLTRLRSPDNGSDSPAAKEYEDLYHTIDADLVVRATQLVARERRRLVDTYVAWGKQYNTSLEELETRRAEVSSRLTTHLRRLGYSEELTH
ncbi:N-6 DNA methylase [Nocardia jiangxiensis]|uniref:site-specific DNA-methyltransferase (adenine-specific) n=1 Tax=Nocardia jiangxiensis TaxID=282685 RepID=A0ABW6RSB4_9NOCA